MILSAVLASEEKKVTEVVDVVGQEGSIIGEGDTGDCLAPEGDAKLGDLC